MARVSEPICVVLEVARVQTLADGGIRLTLDAPETAIMQAAMLMECKRVGLPLEAVFMPVELDKVEKEERSQIENNPVWVPLS